MDVSTIKGPDDLPFAPTEETREAIEDLISAWKEDSPMVGFCMDDLVGAARTQSPDECEWIRRYYIAGEGEGAIDGAGS